MMKSSVEALFSLLMTPSETEVVESSGIVLPYPFF